MSISVIFTGGTIGSKVNDSGNISVDYESGDEISLSAFDTFTISEPYRILSENLKAENIISLVNEVDRIIRKNPDGIIITHGTDTIQYTSAILQYLYGGADIPIVIVSSAYILSDPRSNGMDNLRGAVEFINKRHGKGVFVSYKNGSDDIFIHRASRLLEHMMYSDYLYSVCNSYYGRFKNGLFIKNPLYSVCEENIDGLFGDYIASPADFKLSEYSSDIFVIRPYPGMSIPQKKDTLKAVLFGSYHSGTIMTHDRKFCDFVSEMQKSNIPMYITGLPTNEKRYETSAEYGALGIKVLREMSFIAAYCKLWVLTGNGLNTALVEKSIGEDIQGC